MQNNKTTMITNEFETLKHYKKIFSTLYTKTKTNPQI